MATTTKSIEKGIRELTYNNKDGSKVVKYQVRIHTKELPNFNYLADSLEVAREIVANSKTFIGREAIKSLKIKANEPKSKGTKEAIEKMALEAEQVKEKIRTDDDEEPINIFNALAYKPESLKSLLENWWNSRNSPRRSGDNPIDKKNNDTYLSSLGVIVNTLVIDWAKQDWQEKLMPISVQQSIQKHGKRRKKIGQIEIRDIKETTWLEYIDSRLDAGRAVSTVVRELGIVSSFYNILPSMYGDRYKDLPNPINAKIKQRIEAEKRKKPTQKRRTRLSLENEIELEKALREMRNEDMLIIFHLALATGCRRSEVLYWDWQNINLAGNYYEQTRTKTGEPRLIKLLPESKKVLTALAEKRGNPKSGRLFTYTIDGFKSNWQRVRVKAGLPTLQFRDLRNEFISRFLNETDNAIIVSAYAGIKNQSYFNDTHFKAHRVEKMLKGDGIRPADVPLQVNHSTSQMTAHYNRFDFADDGSIDYQIEQLKLKVKFNKATEEEIELLKELLLKSSLM